MSDNKAIGVLDSGVGGVTVLAEAMKRLPEEDYLYYADTLHVPYGNKPKEQVKQYILASVEQMIACGIKALVIACNTATSIAVQELRNRYDFPIIGMEPAVKPAVQRTNGMDKRVLVFATSLTLQESKFKQLVSLVDRHHIVDSEPLPGLVELAERGIFTGPEPEAYLQSVLSRYDWSRYGTVVLGFTHFPLFEPVFRKLLPPEIALIDGAPGTVRHLTTILQTNHLLGKGGGQIRFLSSGRIREDENRFYQTLRYYQSIKEVEPR